MNILVLLPLTHEQKQLLLDAAGDKLTLHFNPKPTPEEYAQADGILGNPPRDALAAAKKLRWIHITNAGTEPYSLPGVLPAGCVLSNSTGAYGPAISEHMVAAVTMLFKKLHLYRDHMKAGLWADRGNVRRIAGSTVLILGAGDIGCTFAEKMKALGCRTIGIRRTPGDCPPCLDELHTMDALDELLPQADIVAMALPGTAATKNCMNARRLALMKDNSVLINVGRGTAVDTLALCAELESGHLWGASLDVTDPEPLPTDHPLWQCENALITPHVSGYFHLPETYVFILDMMAANLRRIAQGLPPANTVDFSTGYRTKGDNSLDAVVKG